MAADCVPLRGVTHNTCYAWVMLQFPLMPQMKIPVVDRIHPQSTKFAIGVKNNATGDSKHNDRPVHKCSSIVVENCTNNTE